MPPLNDKERNTISTCMKDLQFKSAQQRSDTVKSTSIIETEYIYYLRKCALKINSVPHIIMINI